jgi:hypothetical protein
MTDSKEAFVPIKPGSKEWRNALDDVKELGGVGAFEGTAGVELKFESISVSTKHGYSVKVRHAINYLRPDSCKIIFLLSPISTNDAQLVGGTMYQAVNELSIPGTFANAGMSEVIKSQWDFILFEMPTVRAESIRKFLLSKIKSILSNG